MLKSLFTGAVIAMLAGCVQPPSSPPPATSTMGADATMQSKTVTGSLSYRQKIALPQDAVATISVYPEGPADAALDPVEEESFGLNGRQVPIPFQITLNGLDATDVFRLRAVVRSVSGDLLWTSDTAHLFSGDGAEEALGLVVLVPAGRTRIGISDLTGREWMVASLDGTPVLATSQITMNFDKDGRISGNASCNSFTGSYKVSNSSLYVGPLAITRKACVPQLMQQERAFMNLIELASDLSLDETGTLTLTGDAGETLVAR